MCVTGTIGVTSYVNRAFEKVLYCVVFQKKNRETLVLRKTS